MYKTKLGHVRLRVRDLERAVDFFTRFLHLEVSERVGDDYAFLTCGDCHHVLALQRTGEDAPLAPRNGTGVEHIAFEVPGKKSFARAFQALTDAGIHTNTVDNLISWSIYFEDPEGNCLEIFWDTRYEPHGQKRWEGSRRPLEPDQILKVLREKEKRYVVPPPGRPY